MLLTVLLGLSLIAGILLMLFAAVALIQDKKFFGSAPKEIQETVLPKPERFKGQHALGYFLIGVSFIIIGGTGVIAVWNGFENDYSFWQFFGRFTAIFYIYKAFDMTFLDYFLLMKSHFFEHYYPEIEEVNANRRYGFNLRSQLIKLVIFPIASAIAAGICMLIK